jgi:hypothetical protein
MLLTENQSQSQNPTLFSIAVLPSLHLTLDRCFI